MKNLLYIFLGLGLMFGCSDDERIVSNEPDSNNGEPSEIKFTLEEVWQSKLTFNSTNCIQTECSATNTDYIDLIGSQGQAQYYNGLAGNGVALSNHYSVDTLVLSLNGQTQGLFDNKGFDLGPRNSSSSEALVNPQYIGHIELVGFNEESKLFLKNSLEYASAFGSNDSSMNNKIQYFTSNVSEEFLNSISSYRYSSSNQLGSACPGDPAEFFVKSDLNLNTLKSREHIVVYNENNDARLVGETLFIQSGGYKYRIISKEYIY